VVHKDNAVEDRIDEESGADVTPAPSADNELV
jgi:hypothetical protein